jgi:hypothetical protein
MAKQLNNKKPVTRANNAELKRLRYLIAFPVIALVIKLITMGNIQGGGWLGADGENYFKGVDGLYADGFFSTAEILNYWPAGYPILLWLLALISFSNLVYLMSFMQSIFFAYATYYMTKNISKTSVAWLAAPASFFISFNPTLSLSTLAVGYEAPVAACFMMAMGIIVYSKFNLNSNLLILAVFAGFWISLASFMQPRYLLAGFLLFTIWGLSFQIKKIGAMVLVASFLVALAAPAIMVARNSVAIDKSIVSTNFAAAINYGAGDQATGGYNRVGDFVPCKPKDPTAKVTDNETILCVIKWYLANPVKTAQLSFNKTQFFWSPWSGPLANGTMARNPWLKISPTQDLLKDQSGVQMVTGPVGKLISWLWIIGQIFFLFLGYFMMRRVDALAKLIANLSMSAVVTSWLVAIGTIGDHRFRIPTMGLSLLLQVFAIWKIRKRIAKAL